MPRALICEDDESIRRLVYTVVTRHGFAADVAGNGRVAIEKLSKDCYDILLLDLMMPEADGYSVVEYIRRTKPETLKRIVVMTAATEALKRDFPVPICTVIPKPFDIDRLAEAIRDCASACQ